MKKYKTFAQTVLKSNLKYINYDFEKRKRLREISKNIYLDLNIAKNNLLDLKEVFDFHGINFILVYGTLLGAVRDKYFIEYDTDTDIAIYIEDYNKLIIASADLLKKGFSLIRSKYPDDLVTFMRDDEYIDIAIFRKVKINSDYFYVYQNNYVQNINFFQTKEISFLNHTFKIPQAYTSLLTDWYGSNWGKKRIKNRPAWPTKNFSYLRKLLFITKTRIPFLQSVTNKTKIIIIKLLNVINNK